MRPSLGLEPPYSHCQPSHLNAALTETIWLAPLNQLTLALADDPTQFLPPLPTRLESMPLPCNHPPASHSLHWTHLMKIQSCSALLSSALCLPQEAEHSWKYTHKLSCAHWIRQHKFRRVARAPWKEISLDVSSPTLKAAVSHVRSLQTACTPFPMLTLECWHCLKWQKTAAIARKALIIQRPNRPNSLHLISGSQPLLLFLGMKRSCSSFPTGSSILCPPALPARPSGPLKNFAVIPSPWQAVLCPGRQGLRSPRGQFCNTLIESFSRHQRGKKLFVCSLRVSDWDSQIKQIKTRLARKMYLVTQAWVHVKLWLTEVFRIWGLYTLLVGEGEGGKDTYENMDDV